jgi:hypothetical protein
MQSLALLLVLTLAPSASLAEAVTTSPSPSPVPTMQNVPSLEQTYKLWQRIAPRDREITRRFRTGMLSALTPGQRTEVGATIGGYLVSDTLNREETIQRVNALLDRDARAKIVAAMSTFFAEQSALNEESQAEMLREFPDATNNQQPAQRVQVPPIDPSRAGSILVGWLLAPQPRPIENMTFAQMRTASPLQFSTNDSPRLQQQMRTEMLAALSPQQRSEVADVIGQYAVSTDADQAALSTRIDSILSAQESKTIVAAYANFVAHQKDDMTQLQARMQRIRSRMPPGEQPLFSMPTLAESPEDSDAGAVLAKALLAQSMIVKAVFDKGADAAP